MRIRTLIPFLAAALFLGMWGSQPAAAEDERGVVSIVNRYGSESYRVFEYPSRVNAFFLYPHSYVTFDTSNGKYWEIESHRTKFFENNFPRSGWSDIFGASDPRDALYPEHVKVSFYTPDMRLLGSWDRVRANKKFSIPRDGNNYERLVVKIECEAQDNWDIKMRIWDPVDPVLAEPIPHQVYHR